MVAVHDVILHNGRMQIEVNREWEGKWAQFKGMERNLEKAEN